MEIKTTISLTPDQWKLVEECVRSTILQIEDIQHGFPMQEPPRLDDRELSRIRYDISFGYNPQGEGVHESITRRAKLDKMRNG